MSEAGNSAEVFENNERLDPMQRRALAILQEKEEPPTETIAFFVGRAKATRATFQQFADQIQQAEKQLSALRTRAVELRGVLMAYADDVKKLLEEERSEPTIITPNS